MSVSTLEILTEAKELLNKPKGYVKGKLWDGCGGYCALGAVYAAAGRHYGITKAEDTLQDIRVWPHVGPAQQLLNKHSPDFSLVTTNNVRDLDAVNKMFCAAITEAATLGEETHGEG